MSNPTSNFGWQMPTATDLVTDLPADFEVFGQAVDTALMDLKGGTTGQVLKKNTNADMDFVWAADSAGMTNPMTTTGDTIYSSSGSTPARLGIGSTGQVLTVSGGLPVWAAPAGGGKVLQVVYGSTTTSVTNSSGSYSDTTLTATITPSSATSKVLVLVNQNGCSKTVTNANTSLTLKLQRSGTDLAFLTDGGLATGTTLKLTSFNYSISVLDSPATTSARTYKTVFMEGNALSSVSVQSDGSTSTIVLLEIGA